MLSEKWQKLQNGSDIRGIALAGIEGQSVNLTEETAQAIASAFGFWLSGVKNKPLNELRIAIGNDSRLSAPNLNKAITKGLTLLGCDVSDCGLASTPAMFMSTVTPGFKYDGAIMITASHLPFNRNGMKFFIDKGGLEKQDITAILTIAEKGEFTYSNELGNVASVDLMTVYANLLVEKIRRDVAHPRNRLQPLTGFKIIVDAGNGAGGFFVDKVLKPLGADTNGSQFLEPDGSFPNHIPNPEDQEAMESISKAVIQNQADFGIIFDTDVDRSSAVDNTGKEINRNRIIALAVAIVLEEHPGSTIVTDSITSSGLKTFIEKQLGGVHHRFKRGYKNVINEAIRLNNAGIESHLAIETSGHGALKENYFLDDGAYLIAKILIKMAKLKLEKGTTINSLIASLAEPLESKEFRLNILVDDFKSYGEEVLTNLREYAAKMPDWMVEPINYEGIRVSFGKNNGDGWFLLRMSLHDPLLPLNIESNIAGGAKAISTALLPFLLKYDQLDISAIHAHLKSL
jgi:phosphomannomutase